MNASSEKTAAAGKSETSTRGTAPKRLSDAKFLEYYKTHAAMLLRVVARAGVPSASVEDVCQEVWREVFQKTETHFTGNDQDFRSWLCQIGRNRATDWLRKKDNQVKPIDDNWEREDKSEQTALAVQVYQEEHAALSGCVEQLKEPRCTIVRERLSGTEIVVIAEKVQLTREQVDRQFHAAKEQLKACVQQKLKDVATKGAL